MSLLFVWKKGGDMFFQDMFVFFLGEGRGVQILFGVDLCNKNRFTSYTPGASNSSLAVKWGIL